MHSADPIAITVEQLGKQYRLGSNHGAYRTLRESLAEVFWAPFRRLRQKRTFRPRSSPAPGHGTIWALKEVSLTIPQGEILGIIGRKGACSGLGHCREFAVGFGLCHQNHGVFFPGSAASLDCPHAPGPVGDAPVGLQKPEIFPNLWTQQPLCGDCRSRQPRPAPGQKPHGPALAGDPLPGFF